MQKSLGQDDLKDTIERKMKATDNKKVKRYSIESLLEAKKIEETGRLDMQQKIIREHSNVDRSLLTEDLIFKDDNPNNKIYKLVTKIIEKIDEKPKLNIGYMCDCKIYGPNLPAKREFLKVKLINYSNNIYKCTICKKQFKLTKEEQIRLRSLVLDLKMKQKNKSKKKLHSK